MESLRIGPEMQSIDGAIIAKMLKPLNIQSSGR